MSSESKPRAFYTHIKRKSGKTTAIKEHEKGDFVLLDLDSTILKVPGLVMKGPRRPIMVLEPQMSVKSTGWFYSDSALDCKLRASQERTN